MSKGNLYTQYIRKSDLSIELRTKLKDEFRKPVRDWKVIRDLQERLFKESERTKPKKRTPEQEYGMFGWKVRENANNNI